MLDGHLRVALGILIVVVTGLPWFVAMYMRHGPAFTDRLLVYDHLARLTSGVHGDNGPIDYFMAQLGPGMFAWIALAPAALTIFLHMKSKHTAVSNQPSVEANIDPRRDMTTLIALWFVGAFVLFNAMVTKFHHYIFPAVPPVAILVGLARVFANVHHGIDILGSVVIALVSVALAYIGVRWLQKRYIGMVTLFTH